MAKGESKTKPAALPMDVRDVLVSTIHIGAQMLRHEPHDDDVQELAVDIASHGLMQPIGVAPRDAGGFQLLWGSRRLAAHIRLGRAVIPARVCDAHTTEEVIATATRENLLRRDLTLAEEIDAIRRLTAEGRSPAQISDLVGKSRAWVDRRLAFDSLPADIRDHVLDGALPLGHAETLALVEDPGTRSYFLTHCLQHRPSLAALRATLEAIAQTPTFGDAVEAGAQTAQQASPSGELLQACHTCEQPIPLIKLIVLRVCAHCAGALKGCAAPSASAEEQH
jgi:ParB/RepB/Spo0J family partition protein